MVTTKFDRRSTFGIKCIECNCDLIAPERSEYVEGRHIRHQWLCANCYASFVSLEQIPVEVMTADDIAPPELVA